MWSRNLSLRLDNEPPENRASTGVAGVELSTAVPLFSMRLKRTTGKALETRRAAFWSQAFVRNAAPSAAGSVAPLTKPKYCDPVVAIVAADKEGLKAARLRNHHLRGSSAINYEADVIMILNEKYSIVAKVNIEFNPYQAQRFRDWIVLTVEKNRSGQHSVDIEFQKHFEYACFDPTGRTVQEKLIEERLFND